MPHERRFHSTVQPLEHCRLCWAPILPDPRQVEQGERYVYYRCSNCAGSFPIRRSDLMLLRRQPA
jgi:hypothetical protein